MVLWFFFLKHLLCTRTDTHTQSHLAKSRYSICISQNGCVGLETSKGKCFLSSATLLLQSTRPALQRPCLCWDSTCQTDTGVKQFMSSLKPNSGKKLCNTNHIFRWCVLISSLVFLGAFPPWAPALTECPCSGGEVPASQYGTCSQF